MQWKLFVGRISFFSVQRNSRRSYVKQKVDTNAALNWEQANCLFSNCAVIFAAQNFWQSDRQLPDTILFDWIQACELRATLFCCCDFVSAVLLEVVISVHTWQLQEWSGIWGVVKGCSKVTTQSNLWAPGALRTQRSPLQLCVHWSPNTQIPKPSISSKLQSCPRLCLEEVETDEIYK